MLEKFIDMLSLRFRDENDLSDVTWALAHACPAFQRQFILFLFGDLSVDHAITTFKREHHIGPARPDFYIRVGNEEFIVEVKIGNRSHHFDYVDHFPNAKFAYITNYHLPPAHGIEIRTWEAFRNHLVVALKSPEVDSQSKVLINAYIRFLTNICYIVQLKKMNLNNLNSLYHLNVLFRKIINSLPGFETSVIDRWNPFNESRAGRYFSLKLGDRVINPYLGIYFKEEPYIYVEFDQENSRVIYDVIDETATADGVWYLAPERDDQFDMSLWFSLRTEHFDKFNADDTELEEQETILRSFVLEVLSFISKYL
jgi:hypothetical protein